MKNPKIIAMYLPQFYEIPENNKWWGRGFTEWTNVKKAKPLFKKHYQPKVPYKENYYNLLDYETLKWQIKLAKKYDIYGFCFYHYWFKGKQLLEKPPENLLNDKNLKIPFCFSWGNHTWKRTWNNKKNKKQILMKQEYGGKKEWEKHFNYLINFFKDKRYIKIDNKPMFLIHNPKDIKCLDSMIKLWTKLAIKNGFKGIHIVETLTSTNKYSSKFSNAKVFYEPGYTLRKMIPYKKIFVLLRNKTNTIIKSKYLLKKIDYDKCYKKIIKRKINKNKKNTYLGSFVMFDDTARRGHKAYIINRASPTKFENNISQMIKKCKKIDSDFLFITAWNEWAEGAYLEPDEKNKYGYLEAISKALKNT